MEIRVRGRVQGVGFRPTVWRIARELDLAGEVLNDCEGVLVRVGGAAARDRAPSSPASNANRRRSRGSIASRRTPIAGALPPQFRIAESLAGDAHTEVAPDAAICAACAAEIADPFERRFRYPFANCTHCGPRLSIVTRHPLRSRQDDDGAVRDVRGRASANIATPPIAASTPRRSPAMPAGRKRG